MYSVDGALWGISAHRALQLLPIVTVLPLMHRYLRFSVLNVPARGLGVCEAGFKSCCPWANGAILFGHRFDVLSHSLESFFPLTMPPNPPGRSSCTAGGRMLCGHRLTWTTFTSTPADALHFCVSSSKTQTSQQSLSSFLKGNRFFTAITLKQRSSFIGSFLVNWNESMGPLGVRDSL